MRRFANFACIDWSGAAVARPKGIAVARCGEGDAAPIVERPDRGWSREAIARWLRREAEQGADMLVGVDFSPSLPLDPSRGFLPGVAGVPGAARDLWTWVEQRCDADPDLGVASLLADPAVARLFRIGAVTGDGFRGSGDPNGRLREVERRLEAGRPSSCFNLVGARQVGRSSLTGMRVLARLAGVVPVWPFDPIPASGPLIVEIYTSIAAVEAGRRLAATKMRSWEALDDALVRLGALPTGRVGPIDDHSSDAILTAAWLRVAASRPALWKRPPPAIAETEGWTFGVPYRMASPAPA